MREDSGATVCERKSVWVCGCGQVIVTKREIECVTTGKTER